MKIIFDYNRTLFNPDTNSLYQGVLDLLQDLSRYNELFLISRNEPRRRDRLEEFGIAEYFNNIAFVEDKTADIFTKLVGSCKNVFVIGDRVREEIAIGNKLGFRTIRVQQGKFANELPINPLEQAMFTVKNITDIQIIISKYEK